MFTFQQQAPGVFSIFKLFRHITIIMILLLFCFFKYTSYRILIHSLTRCRRKDTHQLFMGDIIKDQVHIWKCDKAKPEPSPGIIVHSSLNHAQGRLEIYQAA